MKVLKPVGKNEETGGYTSSHHGYDHDDKDSKGNVLLDYKSSLYGKIVQCKNSETRNWRANKASDPYKNDPRRPGLITEDYGDYVKIKGEIDGETVYQLGAHLEQGSVLPKGTEVKAGQVVGKIGNTGNSSGSHCHTEYRGADEKNFPVEFIEKMEKPTMDTQTKEQIIIDAYKALTGEYPNDDEKKARLQQNLNTVELIESLTGDGRFYKMYVKPHIPLPDMDKDKLLESYRETILHNKEILRRVDLESGADSEQMLAKMEWLVNEYLRLKEIQIPKTIIKHQDKDYTLLFKVWEILVVIEKRGE